MPPQFSDLPRGRYPASVEDILTAQDAGRESFTTGAPCPYTSDTPREQFLQTQWAQGRAIARVKFREATGATVRIEEDDPT